ncbi:MAG: hypothetical protein EA361_03830 [Bacteroidetes bacterium]|nr:MAG: hypothetical protein EA361_03830 [Bacteroidota bacterium]
MHAFKNKISVVFFILFFASGGGFLFAKQTSEAERTIKINSRNLTYFEVFREISRQADYFFIYDSQLIENGKRANIQRGEHTLSGLLDELLKDTGLASQFVEKYIILYKPEVTRQTFKKDELSPVSDYYIVSGRVIDASSRQPLPFATLVQKGRGRGISTNLEGYFSYKVPADYYDDTLRISSMGYSPRNIPLQLLTGGTIDIYMEIAPVFLQEVVVTGYDPVRVLLEALRKKDFLYPDFAAMHTSFYREGVFKKDEVIRYSEAVFNIYKAAYKGSGSDQVHRLKSRNYNNVNAGDSLLLKLKAGVKGTLELDVMKNPPYFLSPEYVPDLYFSSSGFAVHNEKLVYKISFENAGNTADDIYQGTIYIDKESMAIVQVDFSIKDQYLRKNQNNFLVRKSSQHHTRIQSIDYSIKYDYYNGKYHIMHVRGDLSMQIREKRKLRGNNYKVIFEMATMKIETYDVKRFRPRDRLKTHSIFSDQSFSYDADFWDDLNFITPEKEIHHSLQRISARIESIEER